MCRTPFPGDGRGEIETYKKTKGRRASTSSLLPWGMLVNALPVAQAPAPKRVLHPHTGGRAGDVLAKNQKVGDVDVGKGGWKNISHSDG